MATTDIDRFLKGVEGLAALDPDEIARRLAAMRSDADMLSLKIAVLERMLGEARRRVPGQAAASRSDAPKAVANDGNRPYTWKRDAILAIMKTEPHRMFSAADLRRRLRETGVMNGDEGTPTSLLLQRMVKSEPGIVERPPGKYAFVPRATIAKPADTEETAAAEHDNAALMHRSAFAQ
ncbi:MAG: hypothetical protein ABSG64_04850 [Solirubrobacteraceae bacterium]|jgi:hypothetical protein